MIDRQTRADERLPSACRAHVAGRGATGRKARDARRSLRGRRRHRHRGAPHRRSDVARARPQRHHRERGRRRQHDRERSRRALGARRLDRAHQSCRAAGGAEPVQQPALRHANRLRADRPRQQRADAADRPQVDSGREPEGLRRLDQGAGREGELRAWRHRHQQPPVRRDDGRCARLQADGRGLSRLGAGDHRSPRRADRSVCGTRSPTRSRRSRPARCMASPSRRRSGSSS